MTSRDGTRRKRHASRRGKSGEFVRHSSRPSSACMYQQPLPSRSSLWRSLSHGSIRITPAPTSRGGSCHERRQGKRHAIRQRGSLRALDRTWRSNRDPGHRLDPVASRASAVLKFTPAARASAMGFSLEIGPYGFAPYSCRVSHDASEGAGRGR
jgi:hypothetical protein